MKFEDWGLIPYTEALNKQLEYVEKVKNSSTENKDSGYLIFCTHPPIVTKGRQTQDSDIFNWSGETIEISRGGRATYHGPSQLVIYPILNLKFSRNNRKPQEIRGFLRDFENGIVTALSKFNIQAEGKTLQKKINAESMTDETGVWVQSQKIASLGIAVKNWITYHGAAINVDHDPLAFSGINPCGFTTSTMVSMESLLRQSVDRERFKDVLKKELILLL